MLRFAPGLIEIALLVFCVIDLVQSPEIEIRNLPKWSWLLLIIFIPLVGGIAWLVAGRPVRASSQVWRPGSGFPENARPTAVTDDIDARLDADLARLDREHDESLRQWQADLERREAALPPPTDEDPPR